MFLVLRVNKATRKILKYLKIKNELRQKKKEVKRNIYYLLYAEVMVVDAYQQDILFEQLFPHKW